MPASPAVLDGVGRAWYGVEEIRERIYDRRGLLVLPAVGEAAPLKTQGCAVMNQDFVIPVIKAMRAAGTLNVPSVAQIFEQFEQLWHTFASAKRKKKSPKGSGRYPKLSADECKLDVETDANAWTDAKRIKALLCFLRKQFLSERISKEPWFKPYTEACNMPGM